MGTTLENGIYLPDEGERNCYDGLAGNWVALDNHLGNTDIHVTINDKQAWNGHVADTTIHVTSADKQAWNGHIADSVKHVTAEDKQAWNGKADASALTAHTGDTTIHVTAEDKNKWDAVTSKADSSALTAHTGNTTIHVTAEDKQAWNGKADASALTAHTGDNTIHVTAEDKTKWDAVTGKADDSGVVHKAGAETITGEKIFSTYITSDGSSTGDEYSGNAKTNLWLMAKRDTEDVSGVLFDTYRQNTAQGTGSHILGIGIKENSIRYETCRFAWSWDNNLNGYSFSMEPTLQGTNQAVRHNLGTSTKKWDTINGIEPSALSLPDLANGVDISGYINVGDVDNTYTPPANGWIWIRLIGNGAGIIQGDFGINANYVADNLTGEKWVETNLFVTKNVQATIRCRSITGIVSAKFYPCQGNL